MTAHARQHYGEPFARFLREKHAAGWSDADIASAWRGNAHAVGRIRRSMGLPDNTFNERHKSKLGSALVRRFERLGASSLVEVKSLLAGAEAVRRGWPADLTPRQVEIVEALARHGAMTRDQIAQAIGVRTDTDQPFKTRRKGQTHLAYLARRGLVVAMPRKHKRAGKGRSQSMYALRPGARRAFAEEVFQQRLYFEAMGMLEIQEHSV